MLDTRPDFIPSFQVDKELPEEVQPGADRLHLPHHRLQRRQHGDRLRVAAVHRRQHQPRQPPQMRILIGWLLVTTWQHLVTLSGTWSHWVLPGHTHCVRPNRKHCSRQRQRHHTYLYCRVAQEDFTFCQNHSSHPVKFRELPRWFCWTKPPRFGALWRFLVHKCRDWYHFQSWSDGDQCFPEVQYLFLSGWMFWMLDKLSRESCVKMGWRVRSVYRWPSSIGVLVYAIHRKSHMFNPCYK